MALAASVFLLLCLASCQDGLRIERAPGARPGAEAPGLRLAASERPIFELRPGDPLYFSRPGPSQALPMTVRISRLVHPTIGAPALAASGGLMTVWLAARDAKETRAAATASLRLETRVSGQLLGLPLRVVERRVGASGARAAAHGEVPAGLARLLVRVPASAPRETFDLVLETPGAPVERQRRAVRVLHSDPAGKPFRFALVADQQLWDPSVLFSRGRRNARAYPARGESQESRAMARQVLGELGLWDPDFAVQLGDLVFGLDYERELEDALSVLGDSPVAAFTVPGNHDAYALYGVDLKLGGVGLAAAILRCRHLVQGSELSASRIWKLVVCAYGDVKERLFRRLLYDGLVAFRRNLGPPYYSFRLGRFQFIALNTYDGSPERRHAYSLWLDVLGRHLGAPLVDNYGGTLSAAQLRFLEREARAAAAEGLTVVFIGHHDPRGNAEGEAFHENEPFPTSPVGIGHFEEWNYDGSWDSDPGDGRGKESASDHSGHALLRLVARYGSAYISGHVHRDEQRLYRKGERILGGIVAARDVTFLRVTTASSSTSKGSYWGYRIVTALPEGGLSLAPFSRELPSVPAGNLWAEGEDGATGERGTSPRDTGVSVHTGLPEAARVRLRKVLVTGAGPGYRFGARAPARARLVDVFPLADPGRAGARAIHYLGLHLPAAPPEAMKDARRILATELAAAPASGNRPPLPLVRADGRPVRQGEAVSLRAGEALELDSSESRDPDSDGLLPPLWRWRDRAGRELGGGR
ncbi:MAG: metallophosphoesterase family protein, partial [Polyangia bacterium]|nr:metallophosphoesterase family protein [Polyangia bacterium]